MKSVYHVFISVILSGCLFFAALPNHALAARNHYDFDGDGKKDELTVSFALTKAYGDEAHAAWIDINGSSIQIYPKDEFGAAPALYAEYIIVDIDKTDGRKELLFIEHGQDEVNYYSFVGYDGKNVFELGYTYGSGEMDELMIMGNGRVRVPTMSWVLQTWPLYFDYILNNHQLVKAKQSIYPSVDTPQSTVKKSFVAYKKKSTKADRFSVKKGTIITLMASDNQKWVKFEDGNGKVGWIHTDKMKNPSVYLSDLVFSQ